MSIGLVDQHDLRLKEYEIGEDLHNLEHSGSRGLQGAALTGDFVVLVDRRNVIILPLIEPYVDLNPRVNLAYKLV
jgi:hypothetical protein